MVHIIKNTLSYGCTSLKTHKNTSKKGCTSHPPAWSIKKRATGGEVKACKSGDTEEELLEGFKVTESVVARTGTTQVSWS